MKIRTLEKKEKEYSETNPRPKEEFAKEFIRAFDGAVKSLEENTRGRPLDDLLDELDAYVEEQRIV